MKKKIVIIITVIVLILAGIFAIYKLTNDEYKVKITKNKYTYIRKEGDIYYDVVSGKELFDVNKTYDNIMPEKLELNKIEEELVDYLLFRYIVPLEIQFPMQSKEKYTDNDIAVLVIINSALYQPCTEEHIKAVAKQYFNIDNYELPTGDYHTYFGDYTIQKVNGYYFRSETANVKKRYPSNNVNSKVERIGNKIIYTFTYVNGDQYNGGCYNFEKSTEENNHCVYGTYRIELNQEGESLVYGKVEFRKNKKYSYDDRAHPGVDI